MKGQKRKKSNELISNRSEEKEKKKDVQKKTLIDTPKVGNINTVVEEHFWSKKRHSGVVVFGIDEVESTSSQTVQQTGVVKQVVLPEPSKLNDSVMKEN